MERCVQLMNTSKLTSVFFLGIALGWLPVYPQPFQEKNSAELTLSLKKLNVLGCALYIAAHPDDENTAVLAYLAKERLVRTVYLSLTRGSGGQNLIGAEKGDLLGVIRTQELLAARSIDGAEQFFTRAIDFGYSKSVEETLKTWDREKVLADVVWTIRTYRPDVVVTRFTPKVGGHGHHLASARLAEEAFVAAADASKFPDQLVHVDPWQARRLVWDVFTSNPDNTAETTSSPVTIDVGTFNSLLGKSYTELAAESRSMHKCQGFGSSPYRGSKLVYFQHMLGERAKDDLFDQVDMTWSRVSNSGRVGEILSQASSTFNPVNPAEILPQLITAYRLLNEGEPNYWVKQKKGELGDLIRLCSGLWLEAIAAEYNYSPGSILNLTVMIVTRSSYPVIVEAIDLPFTDADLQPQKHLYENQPISIEASVRLPTDIEFSSPYWLREKHSNSLYGVEDQLLIGRPEIPSLPVVKFRLLVGGERLTLKTPILFRWTDPVDGEQYRPVTIAPKITVKLKEKVYVFPNSRPKNIQLSIHRHGTPLFTGRLNIRQPHGWSVTPSSILLELMEKDKESVHTIAVTPPTDSDVGSITFEIETDGEQSVARNYQRIEYPHIPIQTNFPVAKAKLVRVMVELVDKRVGYIMGSGDEVPNALRQLGYEVTLLTGEKFGNSDLSTYDVIITGIRAYNTQFYLSKYHQRLLDYVHAGGVLIDQYNVSKNLVVDNLGPYPFSISRDRVTLEDAPVKILSADHQLLNIPNNITYADFNGWIQERGLYFPNDWDSNYETILSCHDPNEEEKQGGILYCRYGKGAYIYTGYSWFRQLPAGIPGAFRVFANFLAGGLNSQNTDYK